MSHNSITSHLPIICANKTNCYGLVCGTRTYWFRLETLLYPCYANSALTKLLLQGRVGCVTELDYSCSVMDEIAHYIKHRCCTQPLKHISRPMRHVMVQCCSELGIHDLANDLIKYEAQRVQSMTTFFQAVRTGLAFMSSKHPDWKWLFTLIGSCCETEFSRRSGGATCSSSDKKPACKKRKFNSDSCSEDERVQRCSEQEEDDEDDDDDESGVNNRINPRDKQKATAKGACSHNSSCSEETGSDEDQDEDNDSDCCHHPSKSAAAPGDVKQSPSGQGQFGGLLAQLMAMLMPMLASSGSSSAAKPVASTSGPGHVPLAAALGSLLRSGLETKRGGASVNVNVNNLSKICTDPVAPPSVPTVTPQATVSSTNGNEAPSTTTTNSTQIKAKIESVDE